MPNDDDDDDNGKDKKIISLDLGETEKIYPTNTQAVRNDSIALF